MSNYTEQLEAGEEELTWYEAVGYEYGVDPETVYLDYLDRG